MAFVNDTFTDTDATALASHTGETGATWTDVVGTGLQVIGNKCVCTSASAISAISSGSPTNADYDVEGDVSFHSQSGRIGIMGRATNSPTGHINGYLLQHRSFTGWQLFRIDDGVGTQLGSTYSTELTSGQTKRGKLELRGTAIKAYLDGTLIIDGGTDSTYSAAGKVAVWGVSAMTATTGYHLDNLTGTDSGTSPALLMAARAYFPDMVVDSDQVVSY